MRTAPTSRCDRDGVDGGRSRGRSWALRPPLAALVALSITIATFAAPPARGVDLVIEAPADLEPVARRLRAMDPAGLERIAETLGLEAPGPPIQILLADEGTPLAQSAPAWVSGWAWGALGRVVLLPRRVPAYPDGSLGELLRHEVAHVLIARAAGGRPLPRWFNEGLAMVTAGGWGLGDRSRLTLTLLAEDRMDLDTLDARFRAGGGDIGRAYALSGALVHHLVRRHGAGTPAAILRGVRLGLSFDDAYTRAVGRTLESELDGFWRRLDFTYRWLPFLTSSATLWIGVTALFLLAARRRRERDRELEMRWRSEDEAMIRWNPSPPPADEVELEN